MSSGDNPSPSKIGGDSTTSTTSPPHGVEGHSVDSLSRDDKLSAKVIRPSCLPLSKVTQCLEGGNDNASLPLHKIGEEVLKKDGTPKEFSEMSSGARKKTSFVRPSPDVEHSNIRPRTSGKESQYLNGEWSTDYQNFTSPQEMFQDDENGGHGLACMESDISSSVESSTPPVIKWAESLKDLLDHCDGIRLFKEFLMEEIGHCVELEFILICNGYRKCSDHLELKATTKVIWKNYIRNRRLKVSESTFKMIEENVDRNPDPSIFDKAQAEIEEGISNTTYLAFLKSEKYLSCIPKHGYESPSITPLERDAGGATFLPTVHEDSEFVEDSKPPRLTSDLLRATAKIRAVNTSRHMSEAITGSYNYGPMVSNPNPYHALYASGHVASQRDSERQSLSSGMTDSQCSSNSDLHSSCRKHYKRMNQIMRDNAQQNRESDLNADNTIKAPIPRTMRNVASEIQELHRCPQKFADYLTAKLEMVKQDRNCKEKTQESLRRIMEGESAPNSCLREHAVNSLPPAVLMTKLTEKITIEEQEPSSILDEHVARVWDSPLVSPGSPHLNAPKSPIAKLNKSNAALCRQLPHLGIQKHTTLKHFPSPVVPNCHGQSYSSSCVNKFAQMHLGQVDHRLHPPRSVHHGRRRERDANSTFSSDSGNVPDYHEVAEALSQMSKSKSMPDYIEGSRSSDLLTEPVHRVPGLNMRRSSTSHRTHVDTTDSGISVVSDSGCGTGRSDSDKRIDDWLVKNCSPASAPGKFSSLNSPFPLDEKESRDVKRGARSVTSVPNVMRHNSGSSGRRSQCSTYTAPQNNRLGQSEPAIMPPNSLPLSQSYAGTPSRISPIYTSMAIYPQYDPTSRDPRDSPLGREGKIRGSSISGRSTGQSSGQGDGSNGSTGSTLKKQRAKQDSYNASSPMGGSHRGSSGLCCTPSQEVTNIVYNFQEDEVPFVTKVPSGAITLKKFKHHLPKKGIYRFFFKKICEDIGTVFEEISDESEVLPLFEGKIIAQIRRDD